MSVRALVLVALVAGALGFLLGTLLGSGSPSGAGGGLSDSAGAASGAEVEALRSENTALRGELREATVRARQAEEALAAVLPADAGALPVIQGGPENGGVGRPDDPPAGGARFFADEYSGALVEVNWSTVGGNLAEMVGLLRTGVPLIARNEPLPEGVAARIQRLVSPVLAATIQVRDQLPGRDVPEKFTSAPFAANSIAATLEAAGLPLDESQQDRVLAAARALLAGDRERLAGYGDSTFALEMLLDEVELKDRFYGDVFAVLSPAQRTALRPDETAGRVRLDVFSSAQLYGRRLDVVPFRDEEQLAAILEARVAKSLGLSPDQRSAVAGEYRRWTAAIPRDLLFEDSDVLDRKGMVAGARATAWGRQFLDLYRTLAANPSLAEKQRQAFRGVSNVLVPLSE